MEELGALDVSLPEYPLHPQTGTSHGGIRGFRCKLTRIPPPKLELLMDGVGGGFRSELIQNPPPPPPPEFGTSHGDLYHLW